MFGFHAPPCHLHINYHGKGYIMPIIDVECSPLPHQDISIHASYRDTEDFSNGDYHEYEGNLGGDENFRKSDIDVRFSKIRIQMTDKSVFTFCFLSKSFQLTFLLSL